MMAHPTESERQREPMQTTIQRFMYAVYPEAGALAMASFDEQTVLRDATQALNEERERNAKLERQQRATTRKDKHASA